MMSMSIVLMIRLSNQAASRRMMEEVGADLFALSFVVSELILMLFVGGGLVNRSLSV